MKKVFYITAILLITVLSTRAQNSVAQGSISGKLINSETNQPIPKAAIRILNQRDSSFVAGNTSANDGSFSIPVKTGSYIVKISFLGYSDITRNVQVTSANPVVRLGTLAMTRSDIQLSGTVVVAKAPEVTVKGDTLEFNADSYKTTESAVVEDLLKKMPGVEIATDGTITVNGKQIKKILVDGEEFFSDDPKVASKNLPAKMVKKVQVLDRKSDISQMTGFDNGDEETVINLDVKPNMKEGLFGNAFAGYGSKDRYEGNAMVNYMKNKDQFTFLGGLNNTNNAGFTDLATSMFGGMGGRGGRGMGGSNSGITQSGNGGFNFSKTFSSKFKLGGNLRYGSTDNTATSKVYTQNLLSSGNTFESENDLTNNYSQNFNFNLRMEWNPDTLTRIIFQPQGGIYNNHRTETGGFVTTRENTDTVNYGDSRYHSSGDGNSLSAQLDISRTLGEPGRILSFQFSGGTNDSKNSGSNLSNTYYLGTKPDDIIDQQFTNKSSGNNWSAYVSYVEPVSKNNYLQFAYTYRRNNSESNKDTHSKDAGGNYTVLDSLYSKRLENEFVNQAIEVNFRADRGLYNFMFGFSVQPSSSRSKTYIGDKNLADLSQHVWNFAPMAQFNYRWSRQKSLRIRYFGSTDQPSVTQLSPVIDVTDPLNVTYGNPDLKPSFTHQFNVRFMDFTPQKNQAFNFFGNFNYRTNDIVSSTFTDAATGKKETTYKNVAGNWNTNGRLMMNLPLKNIKFTISSSTSAGFSHTNGFSNNEANLSEVTNLGETLGINYRTDLIDMGVRGNISYNGVNNSLKGQQDQNYYNYGGTGNATLYLPYDFSIDTDVNYTTNSGYSDGFKQNAWIWNASIQKQIFKQKNGTIRFKIYDILQQRSNINRAVTANYIRDTETNTLTSYFMFHFVYRFNIFKGGATRDDMMRGHRPDGPGGPGGGGGFRPGGGDYF